MDALYLHREGAPLGPLRPRSPGLPGTHSGIQQLEQKHRLCTQGGEPFSFKQNHHPLPIAARVLNSEPSPDDSLLD